jgi:hypothetical protein
MRKEYKAELARLIRVFTELNQARPSLYSQNKQEISYVLEDNIYSHAFSQTTNQLHLRACLVSRTPIIAGIFQEWHQRLADKTVATQHITTELTALFTHQNFLTADKKITRKSKPLAARHSTAAKKNPAAGGSGGGGAAASTPTKTEHQKMLAIVESATPFLTRVQQHCATHNLPEQAFLRDYHTLLIQLTSITDHEDNRGKLKSRKIVALQTIQGQILSREYLTSKRIPQFQTALLAQTTAILDILLAWERRFVLAPEYPDFDGQAAQAFLTEQLTNHLLSINFHTRAISRAATDVDAAAVASRTHNLTKGSATLYIPFLKRIELFCEQHGLARHAFMTNYLHIIEILFDTRDSSNLANIDVAPKPVKQSLATLIKATSLSAATKLPHFKTALASLTDQLYDILCGWKQMYFRAMTNGRIDTKGSQAFLAETVCDLITTIDFLERCRQPPTKSKPKKSQHQATRKFNTCITKHNKKIIRFCLQHGLIAHDIQVLLDALFNHVRHFLHQALETHNARVQMHLQKKIFLPLKESQAIIADKVMMIRIGINPIWQAHTALVSYPYIQYLFIQTPIAATFITTIELMINNIIIERSITAEKALNNIAETMVGIVTNEEYLAAFQQARKPQGTSSRLQQHTSAAQAAANLANLAAHPAAGGRSDDSGTGKIAPTAR